MSVRPALAETIFAALRRQTRAAALGRGSQDDPRHNGPPYSPEVISLRAFAEHSRIAHAWIDLEDAEDVSQLLSSMAVRPAPHARCHHPERNAAP